MGESLYDFFHRLAITIKNSDDAKILENLSALCEERNQVTIEQPPANQVESLLECLEFAYGAIGDAIGLEDGLDGEAGLRVMGMIEEQFIIHKVEFTSIKEL